MKIAIPSSASLLAIFFAALYFAIGPGCFFSVDEVVVQEMAQAVVQRGTLEVPAMNTTAVGRGGAHYAHRGPALGYIALPFVAFGNFLDDHFGSWRGGVAAGPPLGTLEHPLRWGGRLAIFVVLATNAIVGGLAVAVLYLIVIQMGATQRIGLMIAPAAGVSTLLFSESTHFFQHPLETLMILLGFWFFSGRDPKTWSSNALLGGLSLGLAFLSRPNSLPASAVIWLYGALIAWKYSTQSNRSIFIRWSARSITPIIFCAFLYFSYNHLQFGSLFDFGYHDDRGRFHFAIREPLKAIGAYLASPSLSIFLYAPPLILMVLSLPQAFKRWPLETTTLLLATFLHLILIAFFRTWHGDLSYGPRFMLVTILLLMPLSIPVFEKAALHSRWRNIVIAIVAFGICIQLVGISVFVTVNEWYRNQHNINQNGAFVFVPSASPFLVCARELFAGRNIILWAVRAVSDPGPAFVLLCGLIGIITWSFWALKKSSQNDGSSNLPQRITITAAAFVALGFVLVEPISITTPVRVEAFLKAGMAAQSAGRDVRAQEYYGLVLGLNPAHKSALQNLAGLYQKIGSSRQAASLMERVAPQTVTALFECRTAQECYQSGKRLWDTGNKRGALVFWQAGAAQFPSESWLIRNAAIACYELGDYEEAARYYKRASELTPNDNGIKTDLAWALLKSNRLEEARKICLNVLSVEPNNAAAKAILAELP